MAAHDLINAAIKANDKAMKTAIKQGYPVQLPANQYLPKAMNGNIDLIHLGQFADLDAGFDDYRKQQAAQQAQAANQDFSDLDAGFAEWSAGQGGPNVESMRISPVEAPRTASTSTGGQSTGSRSGRAYTGQGTVQEEIPSLDNMAVPVTAKTTTKTAKTATKAEKTAAKEVKQANSTLSKADKALQTAQKKQTVAENNLRKKLDRAEVEAQKADAAQNAVKVTKRGKVTVVEPAQNVQQTKRKMQGLAKEEARAQAEYTKAQEDVRKAEERAKKAADKQAAANDRAQAVSAFAARRTANSGTVSSAEQVTNNAVRKDIIGQSVANQIGSYNAMPKASAVRGTSGRVHSGNGRTGALADSLYDDSWVREREAEDWLIGDGIPVLEPTVQSLVPTDDVRDQIQQRQVEAREATNRKPANTPEMSMMQSAVRGDALRPQQSTSRLAVLSDPNRRLTKEEQAEAEQIIRDYNREHGIHGGIEGWYDGPDDPLSPEYLEYAAVQRLKAKTTGGAIGSGISDAYNVINGLLPEGAAKLADFVTGDPNNSFSQSIRQANDLRDQTMQASQTQAPLAYAGGNMAGKMSQYMATNGLFDSIATGKLGLEAGSEAAFWANQLAQNAQDWAISEIPDYIQNRQNGMSREEALRNFGREALIDAGGNVTMGALGDYVIPGLINRFGRNAVESAADAERAVSNTPAPVDDSVDAALYGTGIMQDLSGADVPALKEVDDYILGGVGRQADDVADAVKAAEPVPTVPNESPITQEQWDQFVDVMSDMEAAHNREGADVFGKYIHTILDYEKGNAGMEDVDEAFRQAQYELQQMGMGVDDSIHKIINPDYRESNMLFESAYRQYNGKYPEAAGAYRQAQKEFDEVLADPNATRDQIIEAGERVKKTIRSLDGKVKRGESAGARGELGDQLAELRKEMGATGEGKTIKVYADPKWADKEFGYEKRMRKQGPGVYEKVKRGKTRLYKHVSAQDRLKGTGITLVDDPKLATGGTIYGKEDLRNYLSRAMELQGGKKKSLSDVKTDIGKYSDEVVNMKVNEALESRGFERATPMSEEELSYYRLYGDEEGVEAPDNWQSLFDEPAPARSMEEAVDEIPSVQSIAEDTGIDRSADDIVSDEIPVYDDMLDEADEAAKELPALADTPAPTAVEGAASNGVSLLDEAADEAATIGRTADEATSDIPILADEADEVADTANHANRSNNVTMTEEELDEAIKDVPQLGPKVDPVERLREQIGKQTDESREYIGRARTNTMARSGIDNLYEQEEVIPEKLFTVSSTPERVSLDNAYGRATTNKEAELERFGKNILTKEELGSIGGEDVDTMFVLRNMLNKQAEEATDEAVKADLYAQSRRIALNLNNVAHRGGETVQSFSKWTRTFDGMSAVAEGRLQQQISDVLDNNPHMKAEIDTMAHKIFDRIGELDNGEDLRTQVHDIVREVLGDSKYLKGKVDDSTITKLTDSLLKEKSFTNLQDQLDYLATGYHPISPETLDRVQELFDEMDQFNYDSKEYFKRELEVYRLLANEIYAKGGSFRDKFDQWRYFAMLANPTTHLKNIMGNVLFGQGAVSTKNGLAALIEEGADRVSKATGGKGIKRTKALLNPKADADLIAAARKDGLENAYRELAGTSRYMDMATGVERVKPAFNPNSKIGSKINRAMDINNRALSGEDELAMIAKYQTSLAGYLKANGKTADIFNATDKESLQFLEDARAYAIRQAEEAAFHQDSVFAKNFSQFTRNLRESESELSKGVGTLMDVAVPFKKTPINILKTCFSYSPLGLARVAKDTYRVAKGTMSGAEMIDDLSKVLTGTAGIAAGALLAHLGIVQSGMGRGEKEQTFDKTTGRQSNAIRIGKSSIGLAELVPAAAPIIYGAIIYDARRMDGEEGNNALDNIVNGLSGVAEATTDMTMLSGFSDILADARSAQGKAEAFKNIGGGLVGNLVGQMFPTVGRKAEITIDDTKRSTYSEKSGSMKNIDSTRKYLQTKIPGSQALGEKLEESEIPALQAIGDQLTLEPAINAWGQEIKQTGGNVLGRAAYNFLSPVTLSTVSDDPVDQELYALGDATGADEIHHTMPQSDANYTDADGNKAKLSEKQWTQYQIENGTRAHEILDQLFQSDAYKSMSDGDKVDAIKRVYSYTKDYALNKVGGKVMNSSTAKLQAAYEEGGVEGVIGELTYLNDLNAAKAETGMDISNNAKAREVYAQFGQEGLTDYKMLGSQFDEIKAAREAVLGKGSTNVDIMSNLTLLNENPDKEDLIIGALVKNPDKYEKTSSGWVYHKGDSVIQADDIKPGNTEGATPQLESGTTEAPAETKQTESQQSQAKAASKAARQQMSELRATQQPEAEEIPVLEEQPKPVQQTASNVEINPATGRPVAPKRQAEEPAVEIDPRTGRPKAPTRSGEIPKLEPNGNATWSNDWEIEGSKSWQRFHAIDPSYTTQDYARVYNAMDANRNGKATKDEIVAYLNKQQMDDAYRAVLYDAFARAGSDNPYKKKKSN